MENKDLIAIVEEKLRSCEAMFSLHAAVPEDRRTEWEQEFLEGWNEKRHFWSEVAERCRKLDCIGGNWEYSGRSFSWRIFAEGGKPLFEVNGKKLPMKETDKEFVYQVRKRGVNYFRLEHTVIYFFEATAEGGLRQWQTAGVFAFIEENGK